MIRYLLIFISLGHFLPAFLPKACAMKIISRWNPRYEKEIVLTCTHKDEEFCLALCDSQTQCVSIENFCRNCAGTSIYLQKLFSEMGVHYRNNGEEVAKDELVKLIESGNFISIDAKSIYNFVDRYDAPSIRAKFQTLCGYSTPYPLVFLSAEPVSRRIGKVKYVICNEAKEEREGEVDGEGGIFAMEDQDQDINIFRMVDEADVLVDGEEEKSLPQLF